MTYDIERIAAGVVDDLQGDIVTHLRTSRAVVTSHSVEMLSLVTERLDTLAEALIKRHQAGESAPLREEIGDLTIAVLALAEAEGVGALRCAFDRWRQIRHDLRRERPDVYGFAGPAMPDDLRAAVLRLLSSTDPTAPIVGRDDDGQAVTLNLSADARDVTGGE